MEITSEIQKRSVKIQEELQAIVRTRFNQKSPSLEFQDCMNVAIFTKLAELELRLELKDNQILVAKSLSMNTINNPLILQKQETVYEHYLVNKSGDQSGQYVDLALAKEMLQALEVVKARIWGEWSLADVNQDILFTIKDLIQKLKDNDPAI